MNNSQTISILSVGRGDLRLSFDLTNPLEARRAESIVTDLMKQGYAVMVQVGKNEVGPLFQRLKAFDPKTSEYIVFGDPPVAETQPASAPTEKRRPGRPRKETRVPSSSPVYAVARSAGGYDPVVRLVRGATGREL